MVGPWEIDTWAGQYRSGAEDLQALTSMSGRSSRLTLSTTSALKCSPADSLSDCGQEQTNLIDGFNLTKVRDELRNSCVHPRRCFVHRNSLAESFV